MNIKMMMLISVTSILLLKDDIGSLRATTEKILAISGVTAENTTLLGLSAQGAVNAVNDG